MADEVTAAQAALLTGLSERTIRRRIAAGHIPARRVSTNRFAIRVDDLPLRGGGATVVSRLDALDGRLRSVEEGMASLHAAVTRLERTTVTGVDAAEALPLDMLREMVTQLGVETERLAPLMGYEHQSETPIAPDEIIRGSSPSANTAPQDRPRGKRHAAH